MLKHHFYSSVVLDVLDMLQSYNYFVTIIIPMPLWHYHGPSTFSLYRIILFYRSTEEFK